MALDLLSTNDKVLRNGWISAARISDDPTVFLLLCFALAAVLVVFFFYKYDNSLPRQNLYTALEKNGEEGQLQACRSSDRPLIIFAFYKIAGIPLPFLVVHPSILGGVYIACRGLQVALLLPVIALAARIFTSESNTSHLTEETTFRNIVFSVLVVTSISSVYTLVTARFLTYFRSASSFATATNLSPFRIIQLLLIALFDSILAASLSFSTFSFNKLLTSQPCHNILSCGYTGSSDISLMLNSSVFNDAASIRSGVWQADFITRLKTVEGNCWNVSMFGVIITVESLLLSLSSLAAMGQGVQWYHEFMEAEKDVQKVNANTDGDIRV